MGRSTNKIKLKQKKANGRSARPPKTDTEPLTFPESFSMRTLRSRVKTPEGTSILKTSEKRERKVSLIDRTELISSLGRSSGGVGGEQTGRIPVNRRLDFSDPINGNMETPPERGTTDGVVVVLAKKILLCRKSSEMDGYGTMTRFHPIQASDGAAAKFLAKKTGMNRDLAEIQHNGEGHGPLGAQTRKMVNGKLAEAKANENFQAVPRAKRHAAGPVTVQTRSMILNGKQEEKNSSVTLPDYRAEDSVGVQARKAVMNGKASEVELSGNSSGSRAKRPAADAAWVQIRKMTNWKPAEVGTNGTSSSSCRKRNSVDAASSQAKRRVVVKRESPEGASNGIGLTSRAKRAADGAAGLQAVETLVNGDLADTESVPRLRPKRATGGVQTANPIMNGELVDNEKALRSRTRQAVDGATGIQTVKPLVKEEQADTENVPRLRPKRATGVQTGNPIMNGELVDSEKALRSRTRQAADGVQTANPIMNGKLVDNEKALRSRTRQAVDGAARIQTVKPLVKEELADTENLPRLRPKRATGVEAVKPIMNGKLADNEKISCSRTKRAAGGSVAVQPSVKRKLADRENASPSCQKRSAGGVAAGHAKETAMSKKPAEKLKGEKVSSRDAQTSDARRKDKEPWKPMSSTLTPSMASFRRFLALERAEYCSQPKYFAARKFPVNFKPPTPQRSYPENTQFKQSSSLKGWKPGTKKRIFLKKKK